MSDPLARVEGYLELRRYAPDRGNMIDNLTDNDNDNRADLFCSDLAVLIDEIHRHRKQQIRQPRRFD